MKGFLARASVAEVLACLAERTVPLPSEDSQFPQLADRVLAAAVASPVDVPAFARSAMDGYAVRAKDTDNATLAVVGEAMPARPFAGVVAPGQAVRITTGAPIPDGADAVLMAELAQLDADGRVQAREVVPTGKNIIRVGEDVAIGSVVLPVGRRLRPQDIGLLASIGVNAVRVHRKPRVAILVTGNELLPPGSLPEGFRIVDSNSPMLEALVARDGGECLPVRYLPDDYSATRDAIRDTVADVILVSGGTSVGTEDFAPKAVAELGELKFHGVALRPAGPMGVGFLPGTVLLLPGNPLACLCAYDLFAGRIVRRLGGRSWDLPYRRMTLPLASKLASMVGRMDYVRVKIEAGQALPQAQRGASNLSSAVTADGFVLVPAERDELPAGEMVDVWLYGE
ncbi:MAG: molybdopterin molybdotransferase MoeA [Planctomycetes bacterium]|nr:molybdopterin molybdotransferase MoeA [Planctomycetota bacterium]